MKTIVPNRSNNFDIIRFVAASQVVIWHSIEHLFLNNITVSNIIKKIIEPIPGVPIFFVISGFLIYTSYERNNNLRQYLKNRMLRIFPGLWFVFIFTLLMLTILGFIIPNIMLKSFWLWVFTQITIFQFYTPDFLRSFGAGNPNGSLWTIFIEFSFYLFIPFLFLLKKINFRIIAIIILIGISILYNFWYNDNFKARAQDLNIIQKLLGLNLLPYLFYFLIGVLIKIKWEVIKIYFVNKGFVWLSCYFSYYIIFFFNT
ncbi:acyltransferase-like protein [Sphingobacterium alimentarium]|uniref:Acyltransferase-like protein n=1 Tax=Sphingobacterium alimentarium TaxID=797292 RepID=A0A4R3VV06_9SPHI|nr:acyltransferase [Sphingobacterium alimentarium]TCV10498.1 acyltransferase-like protein [Sphingobacterium alimentarium]